MNIETDVHVINYEQLHKVDHKYKTVIVDEATKIASYPRKNKARKNLENLIHEEAKVIWLSGSPKVESPAQLFHQLSLSPYHSFNKYDSYYEIFFGSSHYKNNHKDLEGYGDISAFKYYGGNRPIQDYSKVSVPKRLYEPCFIKRDSIEGTHIPTIHVIYTKMPSGLRKLYSDMKTKSICQTNDDTFIANGGAAKQSKLLQLSSGTCISVDNQNVVIDSFKARELAKHYLGKVICVFYKYDAHRELLETVFDKEHLYQIDSKCLGLDLSHYDEMAIFSGTYSGQNNLQALERLTNSNNTSSPVITIFITSNTIEQEQFEKVMSKRNDNLSFLNTV